MDKNWSDMNKEMQALIAKKATFKERHLKSSWNCERACLSRSRRS